ncbi:MAG: peptidylprolyl isomerase [Desulfuromonadaceae bacterium]|nr:peptidylprolyl isomerase [Desulfuromonadaceae bacterium]
MTQAKNGDSVKVKYTGRYEDGSVFDSSDEHGKPLEFVLGQGQMIPAFEKGVLGMALNETRTIEVLPEEGYGAYREDLVVDIDRAHLPEEMELEADRFIEWMQPDGQIGLAKILEVGEDSVKVDTNHPMAGRKLIFEVTLLQIQ